MASFDHDIQDALGKYQDTYDHQDISLQSLEYYAPSTSLAIANGSTQVE